MGAFKELDPEIVRKALEGQKDVLTSEAKKEEVFLRNSSCPNCGAYEHEVSFNVRRPFTPGFPLPNKVLRCLQCRVQYDPQSRIILSVSSD